MSFEYAENILSDELLEILSKYCNMDSHDETHWFLKARYRSTIEQSDRLLIIDHLMKNKQSPFYKDRRLLTKNKMHLNKLGCWRRTASPHRHGVRKPHSVSQQTVEHRRRRTVCVDRHRR